MALREFSVMPRYVNRAYDTTPGEKGSTIEIPIPSAISASAVTPSYVPPDDAGINPTKKTITLDQWYETAFFLNDKEVAETRDGFVNKQLSEAVRGLANNVDAAILALYTGVYGYGGTAGTPPFATDFSAFTTARAALASQLAPKNDRFCIINEDAEANALGLRAIQDASYRGGTDGLREGEIGRVLGAMWAMDQNIPSHTAGTASGATTDNAGYAVGVKTITLASAGTGTILTGDIFTIAGDSQTYVVVTGDADVSGGGTVVFEPGLKVAIAASATAITLKATHVVNLLFQRDAFALAARPAEPSDPLGIANAQRKAIMDPVSGLSLALEVTRQHYRTRFAFSTLYGAQLIRPELAARIAG
jgi:hypothetical protein